MRVNCFQAFAKAVSICLLMLCSSVLSAQQKLITVGLPVESSADVGESASVNRVRNNQFLESYWKLWAEKAGYDIRFVRAPYADIKRSVLVQEIDVMGMAAMDSPHPELLASIPFAYSGGALYERLGDKIKGLPVALHAPSPLVPENYNHSQNISHQSDSITQIINHAGRVNYIYSWNKQLLKDALESASLSSQFVLADEPRGIALRFLTHRSREELMVEINRGIRSTSPIVVEELEREVGITSSNLQISIGRYYQNLTPEQEITLLNHSFLTYAYVERGEEPYFISDDFELKGYTIDVLNDLTRKLGVTFIGKPYRSFQEALDGVNSGEVDIFPGVYRTENRQTTLSFSKDIDKASMAIISESDYYSISDLENQRIALVRGLHENDIVASILPSNPVIYLDTAEEAIGAVANGRADAFVGKLLNSIYLVDKHKYYSLKVHRALDVEEELWPRLAVRRAKEDLVDLLNHGIYSLGDNFQHELGQKWRGALEDNYQAFQRTRFYEQSALLGALFITLIATVYIFYRRQLNRRTKIQNSLEEALFEAKEAKRAAEEMALAKSDFLARMSHEIRTPMNGVLGMAEALSFTQLDKEQTDLLQTLNGSARNLMALLNDVLDFSKMDAGKLTLEQVTCDIESLISGVVGNFRHKAKAKGLKIVSRVDPQLHKSYSCDSTRLMQVLNNLVSNSVKFTENGYVELTAQLIAQDYKTTDKGEAYDLISLQVRDSGIGIPKEKLRTLFDPFVQADGDITRRFGGTGLGLSISKEIVDGMGGEIKVSSVMEHGSLFNILLPVIRIEEERTQVQIDSQLMASQSDLSSLRVLFAEDNEVNRKVIGGQLKRLGVQFETAENGLIAFNKFQEDPSFDLVLSDCHMPEMDGFTLAGKISEQRENGRPYLIAITADALSGAAKRCLAAGFDDYISKPCPLDILEAKLNNVATAQGGLASSNNALNSLLAHSESFDDSGDVIEEDLSWLAEFDSVTPQPNIDAAITPNETLEENDVEWLAEGKEFDFVAFDEPLELSDDINWLTNSEEDQTASNFDALDSFESELPLNSSEDTGFDFASDAPLESLLAELEGIGLDNDAKSAEQEFDFEEVMAEASTVPGVEMPPYQPFDDVAVLTMSGDDLEIAKEILDTFLDNYASDIKELVEAYESKDLSWLKDVAHRIKGSALYLGSDSISQVAKDLEKASAANSDELAQERVEFVSQHLQLLANEIETYCETIAA